MVDIILVPFTIHCKLCVCVEPKPFSSAKPAHFVFSFHPILLCRITYSTPLEMLLEPKKTKQENFFLKPKGNSLNSEL
jgi:hypothetical protein